MQGVRAILGAREALPGTDEFIERCERVRAWSYCARAEAQARLSTAAEPAGAAEFGDARVWFLGEWARVHLLSPNSVARLDEIESWVSSRSDVVFDVLPTYPGRTVALELAARGYRLVAWQPTLYRPLALPVEPSNDAIDVEEVGGDDAAFRDTFLAGLEVPEPERESVGARMEARWRGEGARRFIARQAGEPVAAATLVSREGIARLANCVTLPSARRRGAQAALIRARLRSAAAANLELAVSDARQASESLRNLARAGFSISAHVTQWKKAVDAPARS